MDEIYRTTMSSTLRCQSVVREKMIRLMYTPFVLALGSGELEPEVFNTFMAQESTFREECAKLYEIVENKITDTDVKSAFQQLKSTTVSQHPQLKHDSHSEAKGGSEAISKYFAFIRKMGETGKGFYILASIIPSMRAYRYIAQRLNEFEGSHLLFTKWISTYSSEEFDTSIRELEKLLDKLISRPTRKQVGNIFRVYNRSMRLVFEIFCGLTQPTLVPLIQNYPDVTLFCGFDLCATEEDTAEQDTAEDIDYYIDKGWCSSLFGSTSALPRPFFRKWETPDEKQANDNYEQSVKVLRTASQYLNQKNEPGVKAITPIVRIAFSYDKLEEGLQHLSNYEKGANDHLIKSRLLKGLEEKHLEKFGKQFGFESVACSMLLNEFGKRANVISSSWCGATILQEAFKWVVKDVAVYGNKLCFEQSSSTGAFETKIQSAMDKLQIFQNKVEENCGLTIYIGDALNDILCMIKANIGIVIKPNSSLLTVGPQFGISFVSLYSGLLEKLREVKSAKQEKRPIWMPESGVLYTVPSWEELHLIIFGEPREGKSPKQPKKVEILSDEGTSDDDEDYLNVDGDHMFKKKNDDDDEDCSDDDDNVFDDDDDEDRLEDHEIPWFDYDDEDCS